MIIPIRDLKNTSAISKLCHESNKPVYITKNGYNDMVIMSDKTFREITDYSNKSITPSMHTVSDNSIPYVSSTAGYTIPTIKRILDPIFKGYNVNKAILFGSYAKGTDTEKSDIDLIVDSGLRGLSFFGLMEDIVSAFTVPVDLIEKYQIKKGSDIEKEIKETGITIYEQ